MAEEKELLQGELYHRERGQKYLYVLDQEIGAIYCFKRKVNQIRSRVIILSGCEFLDYPNSVLLGGKFFPSFDFIADDQTYAVIIVEGQNLKEVSEMFNRCSELPVPLMYRRCCRFFRGLGFVLSIPFKIPNVICHGLETVGDKFSEVPDRVFKNPIKENKRRVPGNLASGLFLGTGKMLMGLAKGIGGLVYEPIKGAKESGFKGATKGIGKGILGLVCKPVAGTIDFVTCTVRGVSNTPSSVYKSAIRMYKRNKARKAKAKGSINLNELIDEAPKSGIPDIIVEGDEKSQEDSIDNLEDEKEVLDIINSDEIILPILERNSKLREWTLELASVLKREEELLYEDLAEDDVIEFRVMEAKQVGKKLKKKIMEMIEEVHNMHTEIGFSNQSYFDFNSRMVANLKELGINVKDEYVLNIASIIEEDLISEDESSIESPEVQVIEEVKAIPVINPYIERAKEWRPSKLNDNYRIPEAGPKGGLPLVDPKAQSQLRSVGKEIIKTVGRDILKGKFNLTTISFPIKCMQPTTSLHNTIKSMTLGPLYFTRAALAANPIERLKFIAVATMGTYRNTSTFLKPLNPIIGETLYAELEDGTMMYCEQTCNHPPISHFYVVGPENLYTMNGYTRYATSAGFNTLTIINSGKKQINFRDGSSITITFPDEQFANTFVMTLRHETVGNIEIDDKKNNVKCIINLGNVKKELTDYVEGFIIEDNKRIVSKLRGTYLGYLEFDCVRYWDAREVNIFPLIIKLSLPSDSDCRNDLKLLKNEMMDEAQEAKETLEEIQRHDRKLREESLKKRK